MNDFLNAVEKLSPIITVLLSAIISAIVSKANFKREMAKQNLELRRKDKQEFSELFSALTTHIEEYCRFSCDATLYDAIQTNTKFLTIAPKQFRPILKQLDVALLSANKHEIKSLRTQLLDMHSQEEQQCAYDS